MIKIPIWISNRHVHLSQADANTLFGGPDYQCKAIKDLSQPWQYACEETLTIKWPKGEFSGVRVLGPYRKFTQVEIMLGDTYKLWVKAPIRESGNLEGSAWLVLIGPHGQLELSQWVIVAQRHIHMTVADAQDFWVSNGQIVKVKTQGTRPLLFEEVVVRVRDDFALDMHIDVEEGNAAGLAQGDRWELIRE